MRLRPRDPPASLMSQKRDIKKDLIDVSYSSRDMTVKAVAELTVALAENVEELEQKVETQEEKTARLEKEVAQLRASRSQSSGA